MFVDPITKYSTIQGYLQNIKFLKTIFDPTFTLRDIQQTGEYEITTRWTMVMKPTFGKFIPFGFWEPTLTFTGTSQMGVNPNTGKFNRHIDTWDAIEEQGYFSFEAFVHMLGQVLDVKSAPKDLQSPPYQVLLKRSSYEIREYDAFTVAETKNDMSGYTAFGSLAGYIFGKNSESTKMDMTTPVFSTEKNMQFYLDRVQTDAPDPLDPKVEVKTVAKEIYAVSTFGGIAGEHDAKREARKLLDQIKKDGLEPVDDSSWILARYNDPGTLPPFRKNEVLLPIKNFKLALRL